MNDISSDGSTDEEEINKNFKTEAQLIVETDTLPKKNFPFLTAHYALKKRDKRIVFCKVRHFVNFPKFTKSLGQYLGILITNNEVFSFFVSEDRCVVYFAFTYLITPLKQLM